MVKSVAAAKQGVLGTAATANVPAREANPNAIGGAAREARPCLLRSQDAQRLGRRLAHVPTASHGKFACHKLCASAELPREALSKIRAIRTMISFFSSRK